MFYKLVRRDDSIAPVRMVKRKNPIGYNFIVLTFISVRLYRFCPKE
jgi:hypothetical protein